MTKKPDQSRHLAVMSSLGHGTNDMYWFILPILLPLMLDQFKMDYTAAGILMTAFLFIIGLLSFFMGWASDRVSPPIIIGLGFLLASGSLLAAGFIPSFAPFVFFLLLTAAGVSTFHPAIYNLINKAIKTRKGWAVRVLGPLRHLSSGHRCRYPLAGNALEGSDCHHRLTRLCDRSPLSPIPP